MFTKSQIFTAAALVASASSVLAVPINSDVTEIEARGYTRDALTELKQRAILNYLRDLEARNPSDASTSASGGPPYGGHGGWINPTPGKGRDGKVRQTSQVLAVDKHRDNEPHHPAVAPGNVAHVHDHFHENGGEKHATVKYKDEQGHHVSTLHIATDGTRLQGHQQAPLHRGGASPPPNSPASHPASPASERARPVPHKAHTLRSLIDYIEARNPGDATPAGPPSATSQLAGGPPHVGNPNAVRLPLGKHRQEALGTEKEKEKYPSHRAGERTGSAARPHEHGDTTERHRKSQDKHVVSGEARVAQKESAHRQQPLHAHKESSQDGAPRPLHEPHSSLHKTAASSSSTLKSRALDELAELLARELDLYDDLD